MVIPFVISRFKDEDANYRAGELYSNLVERYGVGRAIAITQATLRKEGWNLAIKPEKTTQGPVLTPPVPLPVKPKAPTQPQLFSDDDIKYAATHPQNTPFEEGAPAPDTLVNEPIGKKRKRVQGENPMTFPGEFGITADGPALSDIVFCDIKGIIGHENQATIDFSRGAFTLLGLPTVGCNCSFWFAEEDPDHRGVFFQGSIYEQERSFAYSIQMGFNVVCHDSNVLDDQAATEELVRQLVLPAVEDQLIKELSDEGNAQGAFFLQQLRFHLYYKVKDGPGKIQISDLDDRLLLLLNKARKNDRNVTGGFKASLLKSAAPMNNENSYNNREDIPLDPPLNPKAAWFNAGWALIDHMINVPVEVFGINCGIHSADYFIIRDGSSKDKTGAGLGLKFQLLDYSLDTLRIEFDVPEGHERVGYSWKVLKEQGFDWAWITPVLEKAVLQQLSQKVKFDPEDWSLSRLKAKLLFESHVEDTNLLRVLQPIKADLGSDDV